MGDRVLAAPDFVDQDQNFTLVGILISGFRFAQMENFTKTAKVVFIGMCENKDIQLVVVASSSDLWREIERISVFVRGIGTIVYVRHYDLAVGLKQ